MPDLDELLAATLERHRLGFHDEAEAGYLELLKARPYHADLYRLVGLIAHQRGQAGQARAWVRRAISLAPLSTDAWTLQALIDPRQGSTGIAARRAAASVTGTSFRASSFEASSSADLAARRRNLALDPQSADGWRREAQRALSLSPEAALTAARRAAALSSAPGRLTLYPLAPRPEATPGRVEAVRIVMSDGEMSIAPFCVRMTEAVVTEDFLVVQSSGLVLVDGLVPDLNDPLRLTRGADSIGGGHVILRQGRSRRVAAAALLGGSRNYYHWLIDHLPRLALMDLERDRPLIVNADLAPFQTEMLAHLGIDAGRLVTVASGEWLHVDDLIVASLLSRISLVHPAAVAWLRRSFLPGEHGSAGAKRIFISRRKAAKRRLLDEAAVVAFLKSNDFAIVEAEDLTVKQQVALFSGADLIVAPHGAALANLVFASPGSRVIEIDAVGSHRTFYPALAALGGLRYDRVSGQPATPYDLQDSDIRLGASGMDRLRQLLDV